MSEIFQDGREYSDTITLPSGPMQIIALTSISGSKLTLTDIYLYPATGAPLVLGVTDTLTLLRWISSLAKSEGFNTLHLEAYRKKIGKRERIVSVVRRLR